VRKGAVPVPYIIALILGIIVVGLLAYWFFILGGKIPGITTEQWCNERKFSFCTQWSECGYGTSCYPGDWSGFASGCLEIGIGEPSSTECSQLLVGLRPIGAACSADDQCASGYCYCEPPDCDSGDTSEGVSCSGYTCRRDCKKPDDTTYSADPCTDRKCT